jgi:hypothetical protein
MVTGNGILLQSLMVTDCKLMGATIEIIADSRIVSHHNFTHSAMEAQSVYVQVNINLLDGNN